MREVRLRTSDSIASCSTGYAFERCQPPTLPAGPSVLPRQPDQLLPTAIRMSGVSFFWEAPATMAPLWGGQVPWAVTANMAVRLPTAARFREGFPGAGAAWPGHGGGCL